MPDEDPGKSLASSKPRTASSESNRHGLNASLATRKVRCEQHARTLEQARAAESAALATAAKREDMSRAYAELAERCSDPLAVFVDGAIELREEAEIMQKSRLNTLILGDFECRAAVS